ncbi:hypothetical protein D3C86_1450370 [compost metagenome]
MEGYEPFELGHVDSVAVWVADLRCGGNDDDLFRIEPVHHLDDAFLERGSSYDTVVDDDEVVGRLDHAIGHVVDMGYQIVAAAVFGNEGTKLGIFDGYFFGTDLYLEQLLQGFFGKRVPVFEYVVVFSLVEEILSGLDHSVKGGFCRVRDVRENGIVCVLVYGVQYGRKNQLS